MGVSGSYCAKKDECGRESGIRICVDYRKLNTFTTFDAFPIPRMEELIEKIGTAKYITKLDLTKRYSTIPLSEESQSKSAFVTPYGLYEFTVMPFGMMTAPATFQIMMKNVLTGTEQFVGAYPDDVVISSDTFDDHMIHVQAVLDRLRDY